jgi:hypothetical protein
MSFGMALEYIIYIETINMGIESPHNLFLIIIFTVDLTLNNLCVQDIYLQALKYK